MTLNELQIMQTKKDHLKGLSTVWLYSDIPAKAKPWQPKIDAAFLGSAGLGRAVS